MNTDRAAPRIFHSFEYHSAHYRVSAPDVKKIQRTIRRLRTSLEDYLKNTPEFARTLEPLSSLPEPVPDSARRMHEASLLTGVGPMAAVAGTFAQMAVESCLGQIGQSDTSPSIRDNAECIVENGGDIFAVIRSPLTIGLWLGPDSPFNGLALHLQPEETPLAVCSSSSVLGHSLSMGSCGLVTVISRDASLADACATAICNRIVSEKVLQESVESAMRIPGINGILAVKGDKMAMAGTLPQLIRHSDPELTAKITRHDRSSFQS